MDKGGEVGGASAVVDVEKKSSRRGRRIRRHRLFLTRGITITDSDEVKIEFSENDEDGVWASAARKGWGVTCLTVPADRLSAGEPRN